MHTSLGISVVLRFNHNKKTFVKCHSCSLTRILKVMWEHGKHEIQFHSSKAIVLRDGTIFQAYVVLKVMVSHNCGMHTQCQEFSKYNVHL